MLLPDYIHQKHGIFFRENEDILFDEISLRKGLSARNSFDGKLIRKTREMLKKGSSIDDVNCFLENASDFAVAKLLPFEFGAINMFIRKSFFDSRKGNGFEAVDHVVGCHGILVFFVLPSYTFWDHALSGMW